MKKRTIISVSIASFIAILSLNVSINQTDLNDISLVTIQKSLAGSEGSPNSYKEVIRGCEILNEDGSVSFGTYTECVLGNESCFPTDCQ